LQSESSLEHSLFLWLIVKLLIILKIGLIKRNINLLLFWGNTWGNINDRSGLWLSRCKLVNSWIKLSGSCFVQFYLIHGLLWNLNRILQLLSIIIGCRYHGWCIWWTYSSLGWWVHSALRLGGSLLVNHFEVIWVLLLRNYLLPNVAAVRTCLNIIIVLQNIRIPKTISFNFVNSLWKWAYLVLWVLRKIR